jgi:hypothetical protein
MTQHARSNLTRFQRRGVAMLLVLIAVAIATILGWSYLASRDNSMMVADNAHASSAARHAAQSAIQAGLAIMRTQQNWRDPGLNGLLIDDFEIISNPQSLVDVNVIDLETGSVPEPMTTHVRITANATVEGMSKSASAVAFVPLEPTQTAATLDLSEFAVFVTRKLYMTNDAAILPWPQAPLASLRRSLAVGTRSLNTHAIEIRNNAAPIRTTVYHSDAAAIDLILNDGPVAVLTQPMSNRIPMPNPPDHGFPNPSGGTTVVTHNAETLTYNLDERFDELFILNGSHVRLEDMTLVVDDDLEVMSSTLEIAGNVTIVVFDHVFVKDTAAITLEDGATLTIFVGEQFEVMNDSRVGDEPAGTGLETTGNATYMDPMRIQVIGIDPSSCGCITSDQTWEIGPNAVVKASIYSPWAEIDINDLAGVYGRVAARDLDIFDAGAVFYDPALDTRIGYTSEESAVVTSGAIAGSALSLASLDATELQPLADTMSWFVKAFGSAYIPSVPPTGPIAVEHDLVSEGIDPRGWE